MCDSRVGDDVAHFLVGWEFERDWLVLLDDVCRIVGDQRVVGSILESDRVGKVGIAVGKRGGGHM